MRFYARKNRIFIIGSILLLLFAVVTEWLCAESDKSVMEDGKFRMSFSRESGFYEEPFQLEMTAGAGTIYYTLDGSIPMQMPHRRIILIPCEPISQ